MRTPGNRIIEKVMVGPVLFAILVAGCKNAEPSDEARTSTTKSEHGSHLAPPQVRVSQLVRSGPGPAVGDKWTATVALNVCGVYLEPPAGQTVRGVTPNVDGTVTIEPATKDQAGHNSTIGSYIEAVGATLSSGSLGLPESIKPPEITSRDADVHVAGSIFEDGQECAGVKGRVVAWVYSAEAVRTGNGLVLVAENPQDIPFFEDGIAVVVTFTPESSLPTLPPAAAVRSDPTQGS